MSACDSRRVQEGSEGFLCQLQEYRKVFKPHGCSLHHFNPEHFEQCLTGRRIIIIGDSTMRQMFQSLACLMTPRIVGGFFMVSDILFALWTCTLSTACTCAVSCQRSGVWCDVCETTEVHVTYIYVCRDILEGECGYLRQTYHTLDTMHV